MKETTQPMEPKENAPLLEQVRERADRARKAATRVLGKGSEHETSIISPTYVGDLASAVEMLTIELAVLRGEMEETRKRLDTLDGEGL